MGTWNGLAKEMKELLDLDSSIVSVKRLEDKEGLKNIAGIEKPAGPFTYCQLPYLVRKQGKTIGITKDDATPLAEKMQLRYRCLRVQGLAPADDKQLEHEAKGFAGFWFNDIETARESMKAYPKPSPIEGLALSPLEDEKYEPEYLLVYGNGAQMTLLMNGLQYFEYEQIQSYFTGEGSCADALPRCVETGKPSLCLPCVGERGFGLVNNDEMVIALPADRLQRTVDGLKALKKTGLAYPPAQLEAGMDVTPLFTAWYPIQD
ncbi:DUF169 domain-containing protein [Desulfovibrio sp. JC010]|uniref:DUF169 domain-containing protein n=1 Tax=Desulfovibrio sp. JC010 TaxID=2593641 RepID=UPI0013D23B18|nr:DUF169 domain-containing protein [Desulfovibrio sp. JC010]NDV28107.1 hypothetical protein [Desulfovibrio sp. JC010]